LLSPERLCLENVLSACRHGANAFNYCEIEEVMRGAEGVEGVRVRDLLSDRVHTVRARVVVNATGPWVDHVREMAGIKERGKRIVRTTKGIHCILPRLTDRAVYHSTQDDRMVFVIPWREFSLIGTTDTDYAGDLDRVHATRQEVLYLLDEVRRALPDPQVTADEVVYTYAGVRPLSFEEGARESEISREHRIVREGPGGRFLSVTGTKLTCFRSLAEEVGDLVTRTVGRKAASRTARLALDGTDEDVSRVEARVLMDVSSELASTRLPRETLETLIATYGRGYGRLLDLAGKIPDGSERLCPSNPDIVAQLHHAVQDELAVSLQDVLLRRTSIGLSRCQGRDCAEAIARRMAELCGWSPRRLAAELDAYRSHVARSQRFRG
jgi:glycerol-3-phosphate dehydrogenase